MMQTAFVIFNGMTTLDFVGVYDPLTRLKSMGFMPEFAWDICSHSERVEDDRGLAFKPDLTAYPLSNYDLVIVPGGVGTRKLVDESSFISWLETSKSASRIASVCTGSLLLGAAGFLTGKTTTTHFGSMEKLGPYCAQTSDERICDEGSIITAGGITAGIDLGLYLVELITSKETRQKIARQMDYADQSQD